MSEEEEDAERDHDIKYRIGEFIVTFSQLESSIRTLLELSLNIDDDLAATLTTPYSFSQLCNVARSVLRTKFSERADEIDGIFASCLGLHENKRNPIVHAHWDYHYSEGALSSYRSARSMKETYPFTDIAALDQAIEKLQATHTELWAIFTDII